RNAEVDVVVECLLVQIGKQHLENRMDIDVFFYRWELIVQALPDTSRRSAGKDKIKCAWKPAETALVIMERQANLLQIVPALGPSGGLASLLDGRQQQ